MDVEVKIHGLEKEQEYVVKENILQMDGVQEVSVHSKLNLVKVSYNQERISLEEICEAMEQAGMTIDR